MTHKHIITGCTLLIASFFAGQALAAPAPTTKID